MPIGTYVDYTPPGSNRVYKVPIGGSPAHGPENFQIYSDQIDSLVGGGGTGGGFNLAFFENDVAVTDSYTITTGKNAMTAGPITVNAGVTVTIPTGSVWSIV